MSKVSIGVCAFLVGAFVQKKFDVCGKLVDLWGNIQESLKPAPEDVEDEA